MRNRHIPGGYQPGHYDNPCEDMFHAMMTAQGWTVTKKGWPDFACWHPQRGFMAVEVKPGRCNPVPLKVEQEHLMRQLAALGIPCGVWTPGASNIIPLMSYRRLRPKKMKNRPISHSRFKPIPHGCLA
jgi:hypothetical protein